MAGSSSPPPPPGGSSIPAQIFAQIMNSLDNVVRSIQSINLSAALTGFSTGMATFARTGLNIASAITNAADMFTAGVVTRIFSGVATFARTGASLATAITNAATSFAAGAMSYGSAVATPVAALVRALSGLTIRGASRAIRGVATLGTRIGRGIARSHTGRAIGRGAAAFARRAAPVVKRASQAAGTATAAVLALMGRVGAILGPVIGGAVTGIGAMTAGIGNFLVANRQAIGEVWNFAETLTRADRALGAYNAQVAIAYSRLSISDFARNMQVASRVAPGTEGMVQAVNRMRDSFVDFRIAQMAIGNQFATAIANIQSSIGRAFAPLAGLLTKLAESGAILRFLEAILSPIGMAMAIVEKTAIAVYEWVTKQKFVPAGGAAIGLGPWDLLVNDIIAGRLAAPLLGGPQMFGNFRPVRP